MQEDSVLTLYKSGSCEITQRLFETLGREKSCVIEQKPQQSKNLSLLRCEHQPPSVETKIVVNCNSNIEGKFNLHVQSPLCARVYNILRETNRHFVLLMLSFSVKKA